jgi:predicted nucleotide-binding protein (sugar kinase/HSP70/actin superfamily)
MNQPKTKLRLGIPRALLYHKYSMLWETFFKELGLEVVVSPQTNKEIVARGINCSVDESCLSIKIFLGHIEWLKDKVDCVFVPHYVSLHSEEELCVKFMALVDITRNTFPDMKVLDYTVDVLNQKTAASGLIALGVKLTRNPVKAARAYLAARKIYQENQIQRTSDQKKRFQENKSSNHLSILIVSHPYTTYDNFLGKPIVDYLKELNVQVLYSDRVDKEEARKLSQNLAKTLYWSYHKELLGAAEIYKDDVDGIIFISTFPCGPDSLAINLCQSRIGSVPNILITLDELDSGVGLKTRLESFVDIIKLKKRQNLNQEILCQKK